MCTVNCRTALRAVLKLGDSSYLAWLVRKPRRHGWHQWIEGKLEIMLILEQNIVYIYIYK